MVQECSAWRELVDSKVVEVRAGLVVIRTRDIEPGAGKATDHGVPVRYCPYCSAVIKASYDDMDGWLFDHVQREEDQK